MEVKAAFEAGDEAALQLGGPPLPPSPRTPGPRALCVSRRRSSSSNTLALVRAAARPAAPAAARDVGAARRRAHARLDAELLVAVVVRDVVAPVLDLVHDAGEPLAFALEVRLYPLADGELLRLGRGRRISLR